MRVSSWLYAAVMADRWRVADVRCSALSVWHHFALEELRNPIAWDMPEPDMDAAAQMLMICSRRYRDGKQLFLHASVRERAQMSMYRTLARQRSQDVIAQCQDYYRTCTRTPARKQPAVQLVGGARIQKSDDRRLIVAPQQWVLVDFIARGDPDRMAAAWDTPYATAQCLYDAHRNAAGEDNDLESRADEARTDSWLERESQRKAAAS